MQITIIDFQREPERVLNRVLKSHKAKVIDWIEKDYGIKLFVTVPKSCYIAFRNEVKKLRHNYEIEDD